MRKVLIAVCCAGLLGNISVAAAQTTGPAAQDTMKTNSPMDANARMKKHKHMKKDMMKSDGMKSEGMKSDGMKSDGMKKDGMDKGGMSK